MKRQSRPWDKHRSFLDPKATTVHPKEEKQNGPNGTNPYVTIRQQKFFSDRFYINKTIYDEDENEYKDTAGCLADDWKVTRESMSLDGRASTLETNNCRQCGQQPSVLFDRAAFLQSYFDKDEEVEEGIAIKKQNGAENYHIKAETLPRNLKAVIFGTYTVDDQTLQDEFPHLFIENYSKSSNVPCLVLYGKRNPSNNGDDNHIDGKKSKTQRNKSVDDRSVSSSRDEKMDDTYSTQHENINSDDENTVSTEVSALATQDEFTSKATATWMIAASVSNSNATFTDDFIQNDKTIQKRMARTGCRKPFPKTVHFSQITASWYKDINELIVSLQSATSTVKTSFDNLIDPLTGYLLPQVITHRTNIPFGVHHSKYILCFESDGSIVICITTSNLTSPQTTDATWIQRFPSAMETNTKINTSVNHSPGAPNDFGRTLTNYLQCTILSTASNFVTLHWFVQTYLQWKSIRQLERNYDFRTAQIQLMTVIPGEYPYRTMKSKDSSHVDSKDSVPFLYGQERISSVLQQLEMSLPLKCRNLLYTNKDKILIQPTSFGGGWNVSNMTKLIRSYLAIALESVSSTTLDDNDIMQRLDIVWPTNRFVQAIHEDTNFGSLCTLKGSSSKQNFCSTSTEIGTGGYLFCSSESFNKNDLSCLNRMVMFEQSRVQLQLRRRTPLIPHFKSVARLIGKPAAIRTKYPKLPSCDEYFSWFMLTSACLSRGAQGEESICKSNDDGTEVTMIAYTNFEMGVLFSSYLTGRSTSKSDRIYCWNSKPCDCCHVNAIQVFPQLIHLPVPYNLRPPRYVYDEDIAAFCDTPYFHEITPGTGCEGNMLLTPHGKNLAAKLMN